MNCPYLFRPIVHTNQSVLVIKTKLEEEGVNKKGPLFWRQSKETPKGDWNLDDDDKLTIVPD